jgi:lipopolysaccharide heptosyltransferase II
MGHLFPPKTYGGGDLVHRKIYEYLQRQGVDVEVLCLPDWFERLTGKEFRSLKGVRLIKKIPIMFKICWGIKEKKGIIVEDACFTRDLFFYNIYQKLFLGSHIIIYFHHFDHYRSDSPWSVQKIWIQFKEHFLFSLADKIVVDSMCSHREIRSLGIKSEKVDVVSPGIDCHNFQRFPKTESRTINVLCVGHYRPRKGIHYLLEAVGKLNYSEIKLHLVGRKESSEYYVYLLDLAKKLNLQDKAIFYGRIDNGELCRLYSQCDLFVFPSLWEGFGIVLLEAMYYRLPIVASNISAIPELVKDGENGLLVPPADPAALAKAINTLIENPLKREEMGERGYQKVVNFYSWETTGEKFYHIVKELSKMNSSIFLSKIINRLLPYVLVAAGIIYSPIRWLRKRTFRIDKVDKILVMAPYPGIGNLVLLIPMLKVLKKNLPSAKVCVLLGSKKAVELFSGQSFLDEVIIFDPKKKNLFGGIHFFFKRIRTEKFHLSIFTYLGDYFYFSVWPFVAGIPYRIGTYAEGQGYFSTNFINTWVARMQNQKHETQQYLDLLQFLGLRYEKTNPELFVSKIDTDFAERYFIEKGIDNNDLILGVHPGSEYKWSWKRWPLDRFVDVTDRFSETYKAKVLFFIGPDEKDIRQALLHLNNNHIIIVENLSLKRVIAIIKRCNIFLSNDSGLMHIATAMKVPVVAVFGPTLYERNRPYGDNNIILRKNLPCSPCFKFQDIQCKERECLNLITSEEVFQALEKQLKALGARF